MAKERLSLLQKQILEIYQKESREFNNKKIFWFSRMDIARHLQDKTEKIYQIPRRGRYSSDKESFAEIMRKIPLIAQAKVLFNSGEISEEIKEKNIGLIENSLSPDAKDMLNANRERMELHKDYDKKQVSLTRSLKSLVEKKFLFITGRSYKKPAYFITQKGLEAKLG